MEEIKAFICEGCISLDRKYLENLSGGKFKVEKANVQLSSEVLAELKRINENHFNFPVFNKLKEDGNEDEEYSYFEKNAKCLPLDSIECQIEFSS